MRAVLCVLLIAGVSSGCFSSSSEISDVLSPAAAFVWEYPYPRLVVEIDHVEGYVPSEAVVSYLVETLTSVTDKRTIEVLPYEVLPRQFASPVIGHKWTREELLDVAAAHLDSAPRGQYAVADRAVLHILFLDGEYPGASGLAIGRTAFLFEPSGYSMEIYENGPAGDLYQRQLLMHEVGHVIGLVNRGVPMVRDHSYPGDPHHSANPESVMWPGFDDIDIIRGLLNEKDGPPAEFDADDLADLAAFREEGRRWAAANGYS